MAWTTATRLYWRSGPDSAASVDSTALHAFAKLTTPVQVEKFALRYGPLRICEDGLPASHNPPNSSGTGCLLQRVRGTFWEPLSVWFRYATEVRALQMVAKRLVNHRPGEFEDWKALGVRWWDSRQPDLVDKRSNRYGILTNQDKPSDDEVLAQVAVERSEIASLVTGWLKIGDVRSTITWGRRSGPVQRWNGVGLFGGLAVRLAADLGGLGMVPCSGCSNLTTPRSNSPGKNHWCDDCRGNGEHQRAAEKANRERRKAGIAPVAGRGRPRVTSKTETQTS
jgi:hypothetical protein